MTRPKDPEHGQGKGWPVKHGGEAAVKAIKHDRPFLGLAAEQERVVREQVQTDGPIALIRQNAIRQQVAADLYWGAVVASMQGDTPDLEALDKAVKRFGWLTMGAMRCWEQDIKARAERTDDTLREAIDAAAEVIGENADDRETDRAMAEDDPDRLGGTSVRVDR